MRNVFRATKLQQEFERKGYAILPLLPSEQVNFVLSELQLMKPNDNFNPDKPPGHHLTDLDTNVEYKRIAKNFIARVLSPYIEKIFDSYKIIGANFIIKPPGKGGFPVHHDWTFVADPQNYTSLTIWCALVDTNENNGTLQVVESSHNLVSDIATSTVDFYCKNIESVIAEKYSKPLCLKAGECVVFDQGLLHHSDINKTNQPRHVMQAIVIPAEIDPVFYYFDQNAPEKGFEIFQMEPDFFIYQDRSKKPVNLKSLGFRENRNKLLTEKEFLKKMRQKNWAFQFKETFNYDLKRIQDELNQNGYVVIDFLNEGELQTLLKFDRENSLPDDLNTTGISFSTGTSKLSYRQAITEQIKEIFSQKIIKLLPEYRVLLCNLVRKKPSKHDSEMPLHQDPSLIDEAVFKSYGVWCPLIDVDEQNGCLQVVQKSHSLNSQTRPFFVFEGFPYSQEILAMMQQRYLTSIPMKAGQALIYDKRLFHGSPPNSTTVERIAAICSLVPKAILSHFCYRETLTSSKVELFEVEDEFYDRYIVEQRPEGVKSLGIFDYEVEPLTPKILIEKLDKANSNLEIPIWANDQISFKPDILKKFNPSAQKVAVLVSNEYEGLTRNGGIGTYYTNLSQKLAADGWVVILLLCQAEVEDQDKSQLDHIAQIVSLRQVPQLLTFQPLHQHILNAAQQGHTNRSFDYQSICCLFFIESLISAFPEAVVYTEFPEIWGFCYHTIQAKRAGTLSHNCLIGVTSHGSFEWLREINSQYQTIDDRWFWQASHYEQFSYENADVTYSPSQFLKEKVASYGWRTDHVKHLPYFIPSLQLPLSGSRTKSIEIKPNHIPVVFFGRLEERKGLCDFLEAVKLLEPTVADQIHLIFMGKAVPLHSPCLVPLNSQHYIERELSDEFVYTLCTDFSSQEAVAAIAQLHYPIVCLTSLQENFPNAALEMGQLPVHLVVSDTGGFHETLDLVQRTDAVHWFHPGNANSLAQVLTQAVKSVAKQPSILPPETHHQTNQHLLNQRLEYMSQAFLAAAPKEPLTPDVTLILICRQSGNSVLECLTSLAAQTYEHLNITVVAPARADELTAAAIAQTQTQFPDYKYLTVEDGWSLGTTYNHLIQQATGEYILFFPANQVATPDMLERLVTAANESDAVAVVCPQLVLSNDDHPEHITLVDGNLLKLLEFNHHYDLTALFARPFLNTFPFNQERGLLGLNWQLFAAAIATDQPIAYYPYPLYTIRATADGMIPAASWPKERYYLRQFLSQIPSEQWHRRQLNLLLTGFEQITQQRTPQQPMPPLSASSSPQDQAWQLTAQQMHAELVQLQSRLQMLEPWNQDLQAGKAWLESQWQTWMLKAQKEGEENSQLRSLIQAIQTSKFWRLRRGWLKLKCKLGSLQSDPLLPPAHTYTPGVQAFIARMAGQKVRFFQPEARSIPVISIISSCTQGYEYLETTYRSIANQTLQSFEWLLVKDDAVTPEYDALLSSLPQRTPKIRLLTQESHGNTATQYNQAIFQAKGQYLCFVDIGAVLDPTYLEKCVLLLESQPQVAVVNSYSIVFQAQEHWWQTELNHPNTLIQKSGLFSHPVYRKIVVDKVGGFDESLFCCADWDYCLKVISQNATDYIGWTIPEYLDGYRATPHTALALSPSSPAEIQQTLGAIRSRYQPSLSNRPVETLIPLPLTLDSLNKRFQLSNQLTIAQTGKRVLLFCDALDTSEIAQWNCDLVLGLAKCGYDIAIATTSASDHACQEFFHPATADIFHLPNVFDPAHWLAFIGYLLEARQINGILISGSTIAEAFLPLLRAKFPHVALLSYIHLNNQQQNGHSPFDSAVQEPRADLDYYLVASYRQAKSYAASHPNSPIETKVCRTRSDVEAALAEVIKVRQAFAHPTKTIDQEQASWELLEDLQALTTAEPATANQATAVPIELSAEPSVRQLTRLLLKKIVKR